jgi:hypothetical protein
MKSQPIFLILATATIIGGTLFGQAMAMGFIHFKPETGAVVKAGQPITVNGTSAPSNNTRTGCTVSLVVNPGQGGSYGPVKALGAGGMNDYTKWSVTTVPLKPGANELEAQLLCHTANGQGISFTKHLVHNLTATTGPLPLATHTSKPSINNNTSTISPPTVG